jgi:hypothetical protein
MNDGAFGCTSLGAEAPPLTDLPRHTLRPGVTFPDWSGVTSPVAQDALTAILLTLRWGDYGEEEDRVRQAIIEGLAEFDHGPAAAWLARRTGLDEGRVATLVDRLASRDLVVRESDSKVIVGAYPLTIRPTEHRVGFGGGVVQAMCAVDALGTGAMLGIDVVIDSRCRVCSTPIRVATRDQGTALDRVEPGSTLVWSGIRYEGACAATSLCSVIAFLCSEAHLEAWHQTNHPGAEGFRLTLDEAMQVGKALFSPVLRPAAAGRTA